MSSDDSDFVVVVNRRKKPGTREVTRREYYRPHKSLHHQVVKQPVVVEEPVVHDTPAVVNSDKFYYRVAGNYPSRGRGYNQQRVHKRIIKVSNWPSLDTTPSSNTGGETAQTHNNPAARRDNHPRRGRYTHQNGYHHHHRQQVVPYHEESFVTELVKQQLEYYFSPDNLIRDTYIRRLMDKQGYVNVIHLLQFPRVKSMTASRTVVENAIALSRQLEVDPQGSKVRCVNNPTQWVMDLQFNPNVPEFVPRN